MAYREVSSFPKILKCHLVESVEGQRFQTIEAAQSAHTKGFQPAIYSNTVAQMRTG